MLRGEALSIEITPVAVKPVVVGVEVIREVALVAEAADSGGDKDGQHSGLSSLHPTRGTSTTAPFCSASPVY